MKWHSIFIVLVTAWMLLSIQPAVIADGVPVAIHLSGHEHIIAGDAWQLRVHISGADAGETVIATLHHGLRYQRETLHLGTGGVAVWEFPAGELLQAGTTLIRVRTGSVSEMFTLSVSPAPPETLVAFTTRNSLHAYGSERTSLLVLVYDAYGNAVKQASGNVTVRAPNGRQTQRLPLTIADGYGDVRLRSVGNPGLLRLTVAADDLVQVMTLVQHAGKPKRLLLSVTPECVLADGRDTITLSAKVLDKVGNAVTDGTLVQFRWARGGQASTTVINGQATVKLPAPETPDEIIVRASSGHANGKTVLQVAQRRCS